MGWERNGAKAIGTKGQGLLKKPYWLNKTKREKAQKRSEGKERGKNGKLLRRR